MTISTYCMSQLVVNHVECLVVFTARVFYSQWDRGFCFPCHCPSRESYPPLPNSHLLLFPVMCVSYVTTFTCVTLYLNLMCEMLLKNKPQTNLKKNDNPTPTPHHLPAIVHFTSTQTDGHSLKNKHESKENSAFSF